MRGLAGKGCQSSLGGCLSTWQTESPNTIALGHKEPNAQLSQHSSQKQLGHKQVSRAEVWRQGKENL